MVCPGCGAQLTSKDQFCPGCGAKIIRKKRCPECGEMLREGTRFCPSCGEEIEEDFFTRKAASGSASKKKASSAPPPRKKPVRERDWEEEDWEDDEEESVDILSIMTVAVGCILLVIVAVLGFNLFQRYAPKNYERASREQEESLQDGEEDEESGSEGQQLTDQRYETDGESGSGEASGGTLVIDSNVNVRDNPDTQGTNVIKVAQAGESYEYTEVVGGGMWYKILLPEEDGYDYGYVYAEYIKLP